MTRIRRFGVVRTATVLAVLYALSALIFFTIFGLLVLIVGIQAPGGMGGFDATAGGVGFLIGGLILAAVYGLLGWVFTAIFCLLYNVVAGSIGGVELELELVAPPPAPSDLGIARCALAAGTPEPTDVTSAFCPSHGGLISGR